jgi:hypothetical protein
VGNDKACPDTQQGRKKGAKGNQLKAAECGASGCTLPVNFFAFSGKPRKKRRKE